MAFGILRACGRLQIDLTYDMKHTLIFSEHHPITEMIVRSMHHKIHQPTLMLTTLKQEFTIIRAKMVINCLIHQCFICRRLKGKIQQQIMGALPRCRVHFVRTIPQTGKNFAGPFQIKSYNVRGAKQFKTYLILFVRNRHIQCGIV